ncbi:MAG: enoyl-CoA hydratase/isomerase family protein [bacterium]|nr:enoyl-CoA hydratase/isomerase family protein [bacterium]
MSLVKTDRQDGIATVTLTHGKVNALNEATVEELQAAFEDLREDDDIRTVVLTGNDKFFSFGLDIPDLYDYTKEGCHRFLVKFTGLYTSIFQFPKPVIASIGGHAIAGGCILAMACDYRLMVDSKAKIGLNEISFGSSIFAGSVEMLIFCCGQRNAETVLIGGQMFPAENALRLGLVDRVVSAGDFSEEVIATAVMYADKDPDAFAALKALLRSPVVDQMERCEQESIRAFNDIWYSETVRENLKGIKIHS